MKTIKLAITFIFVTTFVSCDVLLKTANTIIETEKPLTSFDIAQGLKEALRVGVDSAVYKLHKENGYFLDPIVKINLPSETDEVLKYARKIPGLDQKIDEVILQINRSAEDAALKAAPIFKQAILSMNIDDAKTILSGADNAATEYLRQKTYTKLMDLFTPIMDESLSKPIVANVSAKDSWNEVTTQWNKFATSFAGKLLEVKTVEIELEKYITDKALAGLFIKTADQEKEIRTKVDARVNDILKRVFKEQQ